MRKRLLTVGLAALVLISLALPVAAAAPLGDRLTVDDGACLAAIRPLPSGVYQVWVYCYEDGYYKAGAAMHLVAAPTDHPSASAWGDPVDLTALPGEALDGTYYVKENAISPVAVAAKTGRWDILPDGLLRNRLHLREQISSASTGDETRTRLQNEARTQQEDGRRVGQTEANRSQNEVRERSESSGQANPPAAPGQAQGGPSNGHASGNARGRR